MRTLKEVFLLVIILIVIILPACKKNNAESTNDYKTANPNASKEAKKVLDFLYGLNSKESKKVLSGQNISNPEGGLGYQYHEYFEKLHQVSGKYPGIMAAIYCYGSVIDFSEINDMLEDYWKQGGLVSINITTRNPFTGCLAFDSTITDYDRLFIEGSKEREIWMGAIDSIGKGLLDLQDRGVVVIFHPLYEMNMAWSWWGSINDKGWITQTQFKRLWLDLFNYYTYELGLNNLLWLYGPYNNTEDMLNWRNTKDVDYFYPGDDYVDIVGLSYYWNHLNDLDERDSYGRMLSYNKPFGLIEFGPYLPQDGSFDNTVLINSIKNKYKEISFFVYWTNWDDAYMSINSNQKANELMNDEWVLNRGEFELK